MSDVPPSSAGANGSPPGLGRFPRWAGGMVAASGLLVIVSWYAHWDAVLQLVPNTAPMQFNTALCFIMSGVGLTLLTTPHKRITLWLGGSTGLFSGLQLAEYYAYRNFGVDEFFFHPYFQVATVHPGRMSPIVALCFVLIGAGLILSGMRGISPRRLTGAGLLACIIVVNAAIALLGFLTGIDSAYGWGAYTRMAANSAGLFLLFGLGLLDWTLYSARAERFDFRHWLPLTASLTLMALIGFVSASSFTQLENSADWRQRSSQAMACAQTLLDSVNESQRGVRSYVLSGRREALQPYQDGTNTMPVLLARLGALTRDDPAQRQRLAVLAGEVEAVAAYSRKLLDANATHGLQAAAALESTGEGVTVMEHARVELLAFTRAQRLLLNDSARVVRADFPDSKRFLTNGTGIIQSDFHDSKRLVIFGDVIATVLLVIANWTAYREIHRRRKAEAQSLQLVAELRQTLAQVKTLTGLIPICGWCKSVRTDSGYWQTVEQYVLARTDAKFTHGLCPNCGEKMKEEILKANSRWHRGGIPVGTPSLIPQMPRKAVTHPTW